MNLFIAGGTGFVGGHLLEALSARGHHVRLLTHKKSLVLKGVVQLEGDICDKESLREGMQDCDAVINLVGIIREFPSQGITFEKLHVEASRSMLTAACNAGVRRYLHMSALGTRPNAVSSYHRTKFRAEELVRESGLDWTIFRPSLIYGPGDAFVNMLAQQLRMSSVLPVIGSGEYRLQPIHCDEVAECFAQALELPETIGCTYEICGNRRLTYLELLDEIAAGMGMSAPFKPRLPLALMKRVISVMQHVKQFPITLDQLQMLLEESICECEWRKSFDIPPRNFSDCIREYLV